MRDFHYTVNVLVKAYLEDTLAHGVCTACAVGNIIQDAIGVKAERRTDNPSGFHFMRLKEDKYMRWQSLFMTNSQGEQRPDEISRDHDRIEGTLQIEATGYSVDEMARIEYAFETAPRNCSPKDYLNEEWMFNGLMAVVDVLADIHGIDLTQKDAAKLLFEKP